LLQSNFIGVLTASSYASKIGGQLPVHLSTTTTAA